MARMMQPQPSICVMPSGCSCWRTQGRKGPGRAGRPGRCRAIRVSHVFPSRSEGHYRIPDGEELWKLFLVIALNKVRELGEYHRAAKRDVGHTTALDNVEDYIVGQQQLNEQAFGVLRMTIDEVLAELPETQRRMVMMRIEGHGIEQIAETTHRAKRSVERGLQNFRSRLSEALGEG